MPLDVYLTWKARASRKTYWVYSLPLAALYVLSEYLLRETSELLYLVVLVPVLYAAAMINIKRSHDRGRSGWFTLVLFVPIVALWPLIEFGFIKGDEGQNKFGDPALW